MKNQTQSQSKLLHISPSMWQEFRQAMLEARQDREEVIGFLFCKRHHLSKKKLRYIPVDWVVPTPDCYEHQSESGLVLKQSFHQYILDTYLKDNKDSKNLKLDIVHVHTHFGDADPTFSEIDNRHEAEYARFLSFCYDSQPRLISGVFNESLEKSRFRLWDRKGISHVPIEFYNSWFIPTVSNEVSLNQQENRASHAQLNSIFDYQSSAFNFSNGKASSSHQVIANDMFARQQIFGKGVQESLGQIKVALIGCGGIGAVFAEQLSRLGVKNWCLVDPDFLETVNLNRMPGATEQMVEQSWSKVHYVKWLIKRAYSSGSQIETLACSVEDESVPQAIAAADLIVVATDNHRSRQVAQELALKYIRPLLCLGTQIEIKENRPNMYARVTVPPLGGGWCLMCANIIDLQQAALESAPQEISNLAQRAGYLDGVANPAVYWLNSLCASSGVGVIHGILSGFLKLDTGLDWIYDFSNSLWLKNSTEHLLNQDCYYCNSPSSHLHKSRFHEQLDLQHNFAGNSIHEIGFRRVS